MSRQDKCPYCAFSDPDSEEPPGGWIYRDEHWLAGHGPLATTMPGGVKITSRRHFTDFAQMTADEAASFGSLLTRLDAALRTVTRAERVHLVSTRDRVPHFHAWLYPRPASHPLRGTEFLAAPQHSEPADAEHAARAVRDQLAHADVQLTKPDRSAASEAATILRASASWSAPGPGNRFSRNGRLRQPNCGRPSGRAMKCAWKRAQPSPQRYMCTRAAWPRLMIARRSGCAT